LLQAGSEHFNNKPKKGIEFLQEHGLLHTPLDPEEMARLLRENPRLDKKTIGEYIGKKDNSKVLDAFVRSFEFHDLRVDEGLRQFLESFRLPGESPVIEHIMEFFSEVFFVLLKRSLTPEGKYVSAVGSSFDQDLFCIIWGPTVAALSYVYDNGVEKSVVQKAITGFRKCSLISAHYSLSDVFDNLVISLCKFTTLLAPPETALEVPYRIERRLSIKALF
ncbi:predicted protein, partial [Nematostella vectensis]